VEIAHFSNFRFDLDFVLGVTKFAKQQVVGSLSLHELPWDG
jgi:hypothetical protein